MLLRPLRDNEGRGCVVDALTLTLVLRLGLEQTVRRVFVAQSR